MSVDVKKQAGAPKKQYDESVLKSTIMYFHENVNTKGTVKYMDIHLYCEKQHKNGEFPYKTSYDFWKKKDRLGRKLVDEFNEAKQKTIGNLEGNSIDIIDVKDVIDKYGEDKNKEKLERYLTPLESQIRMLCDELNKEKEKNKKLEETLERQSGDKNAEKERSEGLQSLLYELFTYSNESGNGMHNLMNTGKSRTKRVDLALKRIFDEPTEFFDNVPIKEPKKENENVVSIFEKRNHDTKDEEEYDL